MWDGGGYPEAEYDDLAYDSATESDVFPPLDGPRRDPLAATTDSLGRTLSATDKSLAARLQKVQGATELETYHNSIDQLGVFDESAMSAMLALQRQKKTEKEKSAEVKPRISVPSPKSDRQAPRREVPRPRNPADRYGGGAMQGSIMGTEVGYVGPGSRLGTHMFDATMGSRGAGTRGSSASMRRGQGPGFDTQSTLRTALGGGVQNGSGRLKDVRTSTGRPRLGSMNFFRESRDWNETSGSRQLSVYSAGSYEDPFGDFNNANDANEFQISLPSETPARNPARATAGADPGRLETGDFALPSASGTKRETTRETTRQGAGRLGTGDFGSQYQSGSTVRRHYSNQDSRLFGRLDTSDFEFAAGNRRGAGTRRGMGLRGMELRGMGLSGASPATDFGVRNETKRRGPEQGGPDQRGHDQRRPDQRGPAALRLETQDFALSGGGRRGDSRPDGGGTSEASQGLVEEGGFVGGDAGVGDSGSVLPNNPDPEDDEASDSVLLGSGEYDFQPLKSGVLQQGLERDEGGGHRAWGSPPTSHRGRRPARLEPPQPDSLRVPASPSGRAASPFAASPSSRVISQGHRFAPSPRAPSSYAIKPPEEHLPSSDSPPERRTQLLRGRPRGGTSTAVRRQSSPRPRETSKSSDTAGTEQSQPGPLTLRPCPHCGRKFVPTSYEKHVSICLKVFGSAGDSGGGSGARGRPISRPSRTGSARRRLSSREERSQGAGKPEDSTNAAAPRTGRSSAPPCGMCGAPRRLNAARCSRCGGLYSRNEKPSDTSRSRLNSRAGSRPASRAVPRQGSAGRRRKIASRLGRRAAAKPAPGAAPVSEPEAGNKPKPMPKWKKQSLALRNPSLVGHDYGLETLSCRHCGRTFATKALERHEPICANIRSKPRPLRRGVSTLAYNRTTAVAAARTGRSKYR